jgi:hypothetical protein
MILAGLFALAWNSNFTVFTRSLQVSEFEYDGGDNYSADVLDGDVRVANIYVRFPNLVYSSLTRVPMRVSIWHESNTQLHSLKVVFSSDDFLAIALEVPDGYPWPSLEFHRTSEMKGVIFYAADLGFQGTGTVTLDFLVEIPSSQQRINFNFYAQITLQKDAPLAFSRQVAEAQTSIESKRA